MFLYQVLTVFSHDVVYPLSILNYFIGYTILAVLIVDLLVNLKRLSRHVSFLTVIPDIRCDSSGNFSLQALSFLVVIVFNRLIWFVKLILSLVLPVSDILAYDFDLPFAPSLSFQSFYVRS